MFGIVLQPASILEHMFDVEDFACSLGIKVVESSKARFGYFCRDTGTIVVPTGVPARLRRSMITHELGHAVYGHTVSDAKSERQADEYAAWLLITEKECRRAETMFGQDVDTLAYELNVTPSLIIACVNNSQRHGVNDS